MVSLTPLSWTPPCQWHRRVWLCCANSRSDSAVKWHCKVFCTCKYLCKIKTTCTIISIWRRGLVGFESRKNQGKNTSGPVLKKENCDKNANGTNLYHAHMFVCTTFDIWWLVVLCIQHKHVYFYISVFIDYSHLTAVAGVSWDWTETLERPMI